MINARAVDKIERHVRDAIQRGARVVVGGERLGIWAETTLRRRY